MSDILIEEIKKALERKGIIFLKNGFRFQVRFLGIDDEFLKVVDLKNLTIKFFRISEIASLEVEKDE